jgi:hypothetical protein
MLLGILLDSLKYAYPVSIMMARINNKASLMNFLKRKYTIKIATKMHTPAVN